MKTMYYLVDGYNVIFADASLAKYMQNQPETARKQLLQKLYNLYVHKRQHSVVVFDGQMGVIEKEKSPPGVKVIFSKGTNADNKIRNIVKTADDTSQITVVSSDYKDIGIYVKSSVKNVISAQEFLEILGEVEHKHKGKPEKPESISEEEINYWLKEFGEID